MLLWRYQLMSVAKHFQIIKPITMMMGTMTIGELSDYRWRQSSLPLGATSYQGQGRRQAVHGPNIRLHSDGFLSRGRRSAYNDSIQWKHAHFFGIFRLDPEDAAEMVVGSKVQEYGRFPGGY